MTAVNGNGTVSIAEYNGDAQGDYDIRPNMRAEAYLHKPAAPAPPPAFNPAAYNGHIVKQNNGSTTAWLVIDPQGHRNWIPTAAVYNCLVAAGHPGPDLLSAAQLNQLPDQTGIWATCTPPPAPAPSPAPSQPPVTTTTPDTTTTTQTTTAAPPPPPPPSTWSETTGGVTHTWSNWTNAGGTEGATIGSNVTVQIACRLTGWTSPQDGNNWWYRIASSPWSGQYYASADAFYNNGATSAASTAPRSTTRPSHSAE